jgi:predicted kinase
MNQINAGYLRTIRQLFPKESNQKVFVINGAPGSGKTHYVKSKIKQGDIALDLDYLSAALSLDDNLYSDRKSQLDIALALRDTIINKVENREGKWENAYIITAEKSKEKVNALAKKLGAEIVTMNATQAECISNILNDGRRKDVADLHTKLAEDWFSERQENNW